MLYKLVIFTPETHAGTIRQVLGESHCGHLGNYDYCSFSVKGTGRFRPLKGAKPFIGKEGEVKEVAEERIETVCEKKDLPFVLSKIQKAHPYEEPAIDIYPLENDKYL